MSFPVVGPPRLTTARVLPADTSAPPTVRRLLMGWLLDQGFPRARVEDLVLAVDEAVSNAVEHAYRDAESPGDVEVRCGFAGDGDGPRWAAVSVIDHGVWRPIPPNRGFRGRGLQMITNLTDWRTIERSAEGTTVTMISFAG